MSVQSIANAFSARRPVLAKAPQGAAQHLTEAAKPLPHSTTRNEAWGFHGGVYDSDAHGEHAHDVARKLYATAHKHLVQKHGVNPVVARNFLDSKHGRWMADAIKGGFVKGGTVDTKKDEYGEMGYTVNPKLTGAHIDAALQSNYHGKHAKAFAEIKTATHNGEFMENTAQADVMLDRGCISESLTAAQVSAAMSKAKSNTPAQHAADVRAVADTNLKASTKRWKGDSHMLSMVYKDHANLHDVAKHIEAGRPEAAMDHAHTFDSAVRDEIPHHVWLHMGGELIGKKGFHKLGESLPGFPNHSVLDAYLDSINGRAHTHDGISGTISAKYRNYTVPGHPGKPTGIGSWEVSHHPDAAGKKHPNYVAKKEKLGDDWSTTFEPDTVPHFKDAWDAAAAKFKAPANEAVYDVHGAVQINNLHNDDNAALFTAKDKHSGISKTSVTGAGETVMHISFPSVKHAKGFINDWHTHLNGKAKTPEGKHLGLGNYYLPDDGKGGIDMRAMGEGADLPPGVKPELSRHQLLWQRMNKEADRIAAHKAKKASTGPKKVAEALAPRNAKF